MRGWVGGNRGKDEWSVGEKWGRNGWCVGGELVARKFSLVEISGRKV